MIEKTRKIKEVSFLSKEFEYIDYSNPNYIYVPVTNSRCSSASVFVKVGDHVNMGQIIGVRKASFFEQNMFSTVSGTVIGFEKKFHKSGRLVECIKIENDMKDTLDPRCIERSEEEIYSLTKDEFVNILKENALIGLGGSSFPTYVKFETNETIDTIIVNGIECEPYLNSDHLLILNDAKKMIEGIKYSLYAIGAKRAIIAIKKKYEDLYKKLIETIDDDRITVKRVGNYYPQGWEVEMIKSCTGIEMKPGTLPSKYGILNFNVSTSLGIYEAIKHNLPVIYRNVSINGNGINKPTNLKVRVFASIKDLIEVSGGYSEGEEKVFIIGGPMMGGNLLRDDAICTSTVTEIIVLNKMEFKENPCIRCGSCVYSCPVGLSPVLIMNAYLVKDKVALSELGVKRCIECGLCSYSCTSKIHLTEFMRKAKKMVQ